MARLIDADAIIDFIDMDSTWDPLETCFSEKAVVDMLESAPTVDAVEVVRCKDCKHWNIRKGNDPTQLYFCNFNNLWSKPCRAPYDFCSYGERKEGVD